LSFARHIGCEIFQLEFEILEDSRFGYETAEKNLKSELSQNKRRYAELVSENDVMRVLIE